MNPVYVQIDVKTLPPHSEHNVAPRNVTGVCGECTRCGRTAVANPAAFEAHGRGPKTLRGLAIARVIELIAAGCPHPLPWGLAPEHCDRRIPRGLTLWALERTTGDRLAVAVDAKGKLVGPWGGVAPDAAVLVVPESDAFLCEADDFVRELTGRGYVLARLGKPEPVGAES